MESLDFGIPKKDRSLGAMSIPSAFTALAPGAAPDTEEALGGTCSLVEGLSWSRTPGQAKRLRVVATYL